MTYASQCANAAPHPPHFWGLSTSGVEPPWACPGVQMNSELPASLRWTQMSLVMLFRFHVEKTVDPSTYTPGGWPLCECGTLLADGLPLHLATLVLAGPTLCPTCGAAMAPLDGKSDLCLSCGTTPAA